MLSKGLYYVYKSTERSDNPVSEKEKNVVEQLKKAIPKMSDFDKGYILGKTESMADEAGHKETVKKE